MDLLPAQCAPSSDKRTHRPNWRSHGPFMVNAACCNSKKYFRISSKIECLHDVLQAFREGILKNSCPRVMLYRKCLAALTATSAPPPKTRTLGCLGANSAALTICTWLQATLPASRLFKHIQLICNGCHLVSGHFQVGLQ